MQSDKDIKGKSARSAAASTDVADRPSTPAPSTVTEAAATLTEARKRSAQHQSDRSGARNDSASIGHEYVSDEEESRYELTYRYTRVT